MSTLLTALTAYYASKTPAVSVPVGIRQDLGLPATVLGYSNDAAGLERYDADSALRVKARIPGVKNELEGVAGNFDWESNSDVVDLAADAVRFRVLGDMALKAIRTDPAYRPKTRLKPHSRRWPIRLRRRIKFQSAPIRPRFPFRRLSVFELGF
jgi:hypothetical protein